jgi:hypothetical protein
MVFNATFNNISVITGQSIILVEDTRVPGENHQPVTSQTNNPPSKFLCSFPPVYHHFDKEFTGKNK